MSHTNNKEVQEQFRNRILDVETAVRLTYNEKDSDQMIQKMLDFIHQELQKARHDWLREEIVKLEGMKQPITIEDRVESAFASIEWDKYNQALQTIIDRYSSELDQPITSNKTNGL